MSRTATAATGWTTKRVTKSRTGANTSTVHVGNSCYAHRHYWTDGDIFLDCWYGASAGAIYRVSLPANAYDVAWGVSGQPYCCSTGQLIRTGTRTTSTSYAIRVKVTYARSYAVNRARVS